MSPATSAQVRRRQAARKLALARQQRLNEERRRKDEQELELAAEFAVLIEERDAARSALRAAEAAMGRLLDTMIGELRIRYQRAADLLVTPEDELKRLRLLASENGRSVDQTSSNSGPLRAGDARATSTRTPPPRQHGVSAAPANPQSRREAEGVVPGGKPAG